MTGAGNAALSLLNASSVVFDEKWSTHLPVIGDVGVELRILYIASSTFTFSITVQVAGRAFNWNRNVSGDITIPINLIDGLVLEVDVAGWAASQHQLSFDLLVKITGPLGLSVTVFHQRVNIPIPLVDEIKALASLDFSKPEQLWRLMNAPAALGAGSASGAGFARANVSAAVVDNATLESVAVRFSLPKGNNKDADTRLAISITKGDIAIAKNDNFADGDEFRDPGNYGPYNLEVQSKVTKAVYRGSTTKLTITPQGGAGGDTIVMNTIVDAKFSDGIVLTSESGTKQTVYAVTIIFPNS